MMSRRSNLWLMLTALCAICTYAIAGTEGPIYLLAIPGSILAWWMTGGTPTRPLPRAVINMLLLLIVGAAILTALNAGFNVELFCRFVTMLLIAKIMDRRGARDLSQIYLLSVFLGIGSVLTSNSLVMAVMLFFLLFALTSGIIFYRVSLAEEQRARVMEKLGRTPARLKADSVTGVRRLTMGIVGLTMAISLLVFVVMPRGLGDSAFGTWGNPGLGRSVAFNDEIDLGTTGLISESHEPVLDLRVVDRMGEPLGHTGRRFYLRGAVLDEYEDGRWVTGDRSGLGARGLRTHTRTEDYALSGNMVAKDWNIEQEISIRRLSRPESNLFTVWEPVRFKTNQPTRFALDARHEVIYAGDQPGRFEYRIQSIDHQLTPPETDLEWDDFEPFESEPIETYTRELLSKVGIPTKEGSDEYRDEDKRWVASQIALHFSRGGFGYTLDNAAPPPDRDEVEWFLLDQKTGHCEFFATAMAAMCRTVGVNARVITGYVATEFNETTGYYTVRASNAHAWVEVEVSPHRWETFDPTPAADFARIHEPPSTILTTIRKMVETVEFAWIRGVVSFDSDRRRKILGGSFLDGEEANAALANAFDRIRVGGMVLVVRALSVGLIVFASTLIMGLGVVQLSPRFLPKLRELIKALGASLAALLSRRKASSPEEVVRDDLLHVFERLGVPKPAWVPLARHASDDRVINAIPTNGKPVIDQLVTIIYAWRFGGVAPDTREVEQLRRSCRSIARDSH